LGGDFTFHRLALTGQVRRYLPGKVEAVAGAGWTGTGGDVPIQELSDIGGISTVRGFARRTRVGDESLRGGLELFLPLDPLALTHLPVLERGRVQIVLWGDAGRVWEGTADAWLTSAGVGLQRYLGPFDDAANLRLDFAFPIGPERPDDVAVFLRFTPGLF
jgi:hemolysin activation/secretion protein